MFCEIREVKREEDERIRRERERELERFLDNASWDEFVGFLNDVYSKPDDSFDPDKLL